MMHIYDPLLDELPEFKTYMDYQCKDRTYYYSVSSNTKEVPLNKLVKEIFTPTKSDNQDSTNVLEKLAFIFIQELLDDLED